MKEQFKIEKGIPVPPRPTKKRKYRFEEMNITTDKSIGDSILEKCEPTRQDRLKTRSRITSYLSYFNKTRGTKIKITTRTVEEGIRFWRAQ